MKSFTAQTGDKDALGPTVFTKVSSFVAWIRSILFTNLKTVVIAGNGPFLTRPFRHTQYNEYG